MNTVAVDIIKKLPIDNVQTIKRVNYAVPKCASQVMCGMMDCHQYAAYVTPHGNRFVWVDGYGVYMLNKLSA